MTEKGRKDDSEKPPMDLLPSLALFETAKVLGKGAKKYGRFNWRNGLNIGRCIAAALRHIFQYLAGEDIDEDTGLHHLACANCEISFALQFCLEGRKDLDDRYKKESPEREAAKNINCADNYGIRGEDLYKQLEEEANDRKNLTKQVANGTLYYDNEGLIKGFRPNNDKHSYDSEGVLPVYVCKCGKPNCPGSEGI